MRLAELDPEQFLDSHWQKSPLLLRAALPGFKSPISADELAGLACEEGVESRLVRGTVESRFSLEHGPFQPRRLERLPKRDWTLLVQDVDKLVPEVAALLEPFRFIPDWRIDDIMVSFAAPGGSVGPHTDDYDVFLFQAEGRRRWQLAETFDRSLRTDCDLKILEHFTPERELVAEPGDILYLPPNVAHFGVAEGRALTFSIGFRAPDQRELLAAFGEELLSARAHQRRFSDPGRRVAQKPAELEPSDLTELRRLLREGLSRSDEELDLFLGRYLTRAKPNLEAEAAEADAEGVRQRLAKGARLVRRPASRFAYIRRAAELVVFVDGAEHVLPDAALIWLEPLIAGRAVDAAALAAAPDALPWLVAWHAQGALEWQAESGGD
jgi:50S ribosomal protein L16 3-hydroxylase